MKKELKNHLDSIKKFNSDKVDNIEDFKIKYLGRKGIVNNLFSKFKEVPEGEKKEVGLKINELKSLVQSKCDELSHQIGSDQDSVSNEDISKPGFPINSGSQHPITIIKNKVIDIFSQVGFNLSYGPEIEDDWHNFTALNLPKNHPARDMQDTFFIQTNPDILLRTHTSSVQVRYMENNSPPINIISPGRVYRNEAISARSHCLFHQVEGIVVDENVSFADLKQVILYFTKAMFGKSKLRFRPSFFPFTEPSAEVDIMDERGRWLEVLGCGMVHPNVLRAAGIDPDKYKGFAFGLGVERFAMLRYGINDLRMFYQNDVRFLRQFA